MFIKDMIYIYKFISLHASFPFSSMVHGMGRNEQCSELNSAVSGIHSHNKPARAAVLCINLGPRPCWLAICIHDLHGERNKRSQIWPAQATSSPRSRKRNRVEKRKPLQRTAHPRIDQSFNFFEMYVLGVYAVSPWKVYACKLHSHEPTNKQWQLRLLGNPWTSLAPLHF